MPGCEDGDVERRETYLGRLVNHNRQRIVDAKPDLFEAEAVKVFRIEFNTCQLTVLRKLPVVALGIGSFTPCPSATTIGIPIGGRVPSTPDETE